MSRTINDKQKQYLDFFGWFLLAKGLITEAQLEEAYAYQQRRYHRFGEFAVSKGYMSQAQVERLFAKQQHLEECIGELAVQEGFLTVEQLEDVLFSQTIHSANIGEALLAQGAISPDTFAVTMEEYEWLEQEKQRLLWEELETLPESDIVPTVLRGIELAFMRFAGQTVRVEQLCRKPSKLSAAASWSLCFQLGEAEWLECVLLFSAELAKAVEAHAQVLTNASRNSCAKIPSTSGAEAFVEIVARYLERGLSAYGLLVKDRMTIPNPQVNRSQGEVTCLGIAAFAPALGKSAHLANAELKVVLTLSCQQCPCP